MQSEQTEFSVSLPHGYGTILPGGYTEVVVSRVVDYSPEARSGAYDHLNIYPQYLLEGELPLLSDPNYRILKQLWDNATQRAKSKGSVKDVTTVPIEMFNTSATQRPF
ncbi:hypothetical protein M407DRAFT_27390, partial [Tulasnella calospora MUT 4182]